MIRLLLFGSGWMGVAFYLLNPIVVLEVLHYNAFESVSERQVISILNYRWGPLLTALLEASGGAIQSNKSIVVLEFATFCSIARQRLVLFWHLELNVHDAVTRLVS